MIPLSFKRHRFPPTIIRNAVLLYARFTVSYRDVEEMVVERSSIWFEFDIGRSGPVL